MNNQTTRNAPACRVHTALTANLEKRLLIWLAVRTPSIISSDHLTLLAFVAQLFAGAAYALASKDTQALWLVNFFLFLNWLGDSLDGTLARVRNKQRPRYGFYVDHVADILGALALITGLSFSGYLHWQVAIALLVGFYILCIESYLATYSLGAFHVSHGLFGPTEIRILLAAGNAFLITRPIIVIANHRFLLFDVAGVIAISAMLVMAITAVVDHTMELYRQEPLT